MVADTCPECRQIVHARPNRPLHNMRVGYRGSRCNSFLVIWAHITPAGIKEQATPTRRALWGKRECKHHERQQHHQRQPRQLLGSSLFTNTITIALAARVPFLDCIVLPLRRLRDFLSLLYPQTLKRFPAIFEPSDRLPNRIPEAAHQVHLTLPIVLVASSSLGSSLFQVSHPCASTRHSAREAAQPSGATTRQLTNTKLRFDSTALQLSQEQVHQPPMHIPC